jgi:hypothetical protein
MNSNLYGTGHKINTSFTARPDGSHNLMLMSATSLSVLRNNILIPSSESNSRASKQAASLQKLKKIKTLAQNFIQFENNPNNIIVFGT